MADRKSIVGWPEPVRTPSRFLSPVPKYRLFRTGACTACGLCVSICPVGIHVIRRGEVASKNTYRCLGTDCPNPCTEECPENALFLRRNPTFDTMGDSRWTPDLLAATWQMAETGDVPSGGYEYKTGGSGGGFDKLRFIYPPVHEVPKEILDLPEEEVDLSVVLNRRRDRAHRLTIQLPCYGGGMSYGSVSTKTIVARLRAAGALGTFVSTGEGGYPEVIEPYDDNVITQVATGLFGVREETLLRVKFMEFKYAQGAKPGLGGHLLGDKVTPDVARMREAVAGNPLFSPFPFHSVYSVEDHKKHVDWVKAINPKIVVGVKVSTPTDVDMVAIGSFHAGAHIIHLDGSYGGTGAAPDIAKKNIAMPLEYAVPRVHRFLSEEGVRDRITVIAGGGVRTPYDVAKVIALGADGVCTGTADLVALECIRCSHCESGRGCARGIATTDTELIHLMDEDWAARRITNMFLAWKRELARILKRLGLTGIRDLVGRTDLLVHLDYMEKAS